MLAMHRTKRHRSPTPPAYDEPDLDLTSPLDILIKRRRRESDYAHIPLPRNSQHTIAHVYPNGHATDQDSVPWSAGQNGNPAAEAHAPGQDGGEMEDEAESSTAWMVRPAVNGRRNRQWQLLNAPSSSLSSIGSSEQPSQPSPSPQPSAFDTSGEVNGRHDSPARAPGGGRRNGSGGPMSSSPIRHEPPGSSPFRIDHQRQRSGKDAAASAESSMEVGRSGVGMSGRDSEEGVEMDWSEEELGREWGEYAASNSVLHSLHKYRQSLPNPSPHPPAAFYPTPNRPTVPDSSSPSPLLPSPSHAAHQHPHLFPDLPPYSSSSSAAHHRSPLPRTTYPLGSSGIYHTPHSGSNGYRDPLPPPSSTHYASSPFGQLPNSEATRYADDEDGPGTGMEVLADDDFRSPGAIGLGTVGGSQKEVRRRYEEANRLLSELAVARMRRWGG